MAALAEKSWITNKNNKKGLQKCDDANYVARSKKKKNPKWLIDI